MRWLRDIIAHFSARRELTGQEMLAEFGAGAENADALADCLRVFTEEYGLRPGWLRAADPLEHFTRRPKSGPASWMFVQLAYEDRLTELGYHLESGQARRGIRTDFPVPRTIGEYVRLYLGIPLAKGGEESRAGR